MIMSPSPSLQERYDQLKNMQPKIRIRAAANWLEVSELELLELGLSQNVIRLNGDWKELLLELEPLGKVMALTRNQFAVHERKGIYKNISFQGEGRMGVAVNEDIDLRFFMWEWEYAYAVQMPRGNTNLYSLQFFNKHGEAVHKIYLTPFSNPTVYDKILKKYRAKNQHKITKVLKRKPKPLAFRKNFKEAASFQQEWLDLKDTHDFFGLLRKYELPRLQALRLAPKDHATPLQAEAIVRVFELMAKREIPIMIFVSSKGCIQIHTGPIKKLLPMDNWFNIMDPNFNLHLDTNGIGETWITKKPTVDGHVTGIEVYDKEGAMILQCFGKRKPGKPELEEWRTVVDEVQTTFALPLESMIN